MAEATEQRARVVGAEAKRVKREVLGIPDQRKHRERPAKPLTSRAKEPGTQQRTYRYRFYPTDVQAQQLVQTFGACRWVYNEGLALRVKAWSDHRVSIGFAETSRALTGWRQAGKTSWLQAVSSTVLQQSLRHLDSAFTRFFNGHP
ncbi:helix-turn-helix domain-containing protein [Streptomyces sp. NPDC056387]|uniref:helix-turn-helix domain-containing protein n=1 Tax=Streptomyces sp. NPDC056387 TaxID=3345803 RepID=UPI0035DACA70